MSIPELGFPLLQIINHEKLNNYGNTQWKILYVLIDNSTLIDPAIFFYLVSPCISIKYLLRW